ncbi:MAG TPA: M14 family zinc carboxypeptidase [Vicinamibacterales bacterium]|nr:M14 family zinc carboxypeptidase [Vicinamibacterales bacterium]
MKRNVALLSAVFVCAAAGAQAQYARDPKQSIDQEYTAKIKEYTTAPHFVSPLVDYLPASKQVPTPKAVLGDVAGAPGRLPYSREVHAYMRMVEKASPRVKVFSIGASEEGREMIAVAISSEANLARLEENRARLAKLGDPRTIRMDDVAAEQLVQASVPIYYITGAIHSPETGSPTALMELVYRLAVDESPYIQKIRNRLVTLVTPVVEVDGRDRHVDVYRWHLANPGQNWPPTLYWGKYVAHDNNRDAMGLTLKLTRNVLDTFTWWHAQVLHDLHESVPYLYDNTVGDGPYNAWLDPILIDEWQMIGWQNVSELTKFGMPGVFTHGTFDTWTPGYLMFIAATHNGISRLYETFGNAGADTVERTLRPQEYARTWFKQNPPLPKTTWSQRNNNNYQQSGLLVSLNYFADNNKLFLKNFYLKSKRSILKPKTEGPAAYVFTADDPRPGAQADLLRVLQLQGVEVSRATAPFTVTVGKKKPAAPRRETTETATVSTGNGTGHDAGVQPAPASAQKPPAGAEKADAPVEQQFPAGSYIVRMDQPYSRVADMLLDYQYWAPDDPQRNPYDDTGWTFGELFNVKVARVTDARVLDVPIDAVKGPLAAAGGVSGSGTIFAINHNADPSLATLRYQFKEAQFDAAEEPFEAAGRKFNRGSFLVRNVDAPALEAAVRELGLQATALSSAPSVKTHPVRAARVASVHTWLSTQDEGWWRLTLDSLGIPYDYISTQEVAKDANLRAKYDVILFPPVGRGAGQAIVSGLPMYGNPIPWKTTELTPNIGKIDSTDDIRPGLGWEGMAHLQQFVRDGGVLVAVDDTADFATTFGFAPGVATVRPQRLKVTGSVIKSRLVDAASPIAYGYEDGLPVYAFDGPIFTISSFAGGRGGFRGAASGDERRRPTGRGTMDDPDQPQGRPVGDAPPEDPKVEPWQAAPVTAEQLRNPINVIPPAQRPRVILRYGDARELLISGLVDGGSEIAQRPMVIDQPVGKGHVVLFSNNPIWRGETQGSYFLVLNTILNFDALDAGRKLDEK